MKEYKVGDKFFFENRYRLGVTEIIKVNKASYKMANGDTVRKDDLRVRGEDAWTYTRYEEFDGEKYNKRKERHFRS